MLPCCLQQGDHGYCTATTANSSPHLCLNNATCLCTSPQGCGHGLPGLVALWAGAEVHFQVGTSGVQKGFAGHTDGGAYGWMPHNSQQPLPLHARTDEIRQGRTQSAYALCRC